MAFTIARFESSGFLRVGTPTTLVYAASFDNEETFHSRIVDACQAILYYPDIYERTRRTMFRHVEACIESHGGQFESLL
jgi:hypothetical protein